jgi:hypothetical protein
MNIRTFARLALLVTLLAGACPGPDSAPGGPSTPAPVRDPRLPARTNRLTVTWSSQHALRLRCSPSWRNDKART